MPKKTVPKEEKPAAAPAKAVDAPEAVIAHVEEVKLEVEKDVITEIPAEEAIEVKKDGVDIADLARTAG
jgi:hypothetical protein